MIKQHFATIMTNDNETHPFMYNMYGADISTKRNLVEIVNYDNGDKLLVSFDYDTKDDSVSRMNVSIYSKLLNQYIKATHIFLEEPIVEALQEIVSKTIKNFQDEAN